MTLKNSFHPYALTTILCWSSAYIFTRLTLQYFSAFSLGFLRYLIASLLLAIIAFITKMKAPKRKDLPLFAAGGCFGFFLYMITYNTGQAIVPASTASFVIATTPVITAFFARIIFKEKLSPYKWAAIIIELAGVAILTLLGNGLSINTGLLWLFTAALVTSIYNLLQKKLTCTYSALQVSTYCIFFGTIMLAIFAPTAIREIKVAPPIQCLYVLILAITASAIAYVSWAVAFAKAKQISQVSNYMFLMPILTSIFGLIFLKEVPDMATIIGGSVILIGVYIFNSKQ